jgi:hypothetical protein
MEEEQARWHYKSLVDGGGDVVHQKRRRWESLGVTRWGERRPWCAPCASLSGAKEKGGDGVRSTRWRASNGPQRKRKRWGVRYGDESENREPTRVPGSEGHTMRHDESSAAQRRGHTGPTTDGVRRACSDSDPACA